MGSTKNNQKQKRKNNKQVALKRKEEQSQKKRIERIRKSEKEEIEKMAQQRREAERQKRIEDEEQKKKEITEMVKRIKSKKEERKEFINSFVETPADIAKRHDEERKAEYTRVVYDKMPDDWPKLERKQYSSFDLDQSQPEDDMEL